MYNNYVGERRWRKKERKKFQLDGEVAGSQFNFLHLFDEILIIFY